MRIAYGVIALIAVAVWGRSTQANVLGSPDVDPPAVGARIGQTLSGPENNYTPKPEKKDSRLAQHIAVDPREASSGNPALVPLIWVGALVIPNPMPKAPNAITVATAEFITSTVLLTAAHCLEGLSEAFNGAPGAAGFTNGPRHQKTRSSTANTRTIAVYHSKSYVASP